MTVEGDEVQGTPPPDPEQCRGDVRRVGNRWAWTVFDTSTGRTVGEGVSGSQGTALIAVDSFIRHLQ